jgi:hypothetical protein
MDINTSRKQPYGPVVNLNGASRESLIEQHHNVVEAARELLKVMGECFPHGRDYQTAPAILHKKDQDIWEDNMAKVNNIRRDYEHIAERLTVEGINDELGAGTNRKVRDSLTVVKP